MVPPSYELFFLLHLFFHLPLLCFTIWLHTRPSSARLFYFPRPAPLPLSHHHARAHLPPHSPSSFLCSATPLCFASALPCATAPKSPRRSKLVSRYHLTHLYPHLLSLSFSFSLSPSSPLILHLFPLVDYMNGNEDGPLMSHSI